MYHVHVMKEEQDPMPFYRGPVEFFFPIVLSYLMRLCQTNRPIKGAGYDVIFR
jgi:hypothetical protein